MTKVAGSNPVHGIINAQEVMFIDLVFLSNELMNPRMQLALKSPVEFIGFAFIEGKMYHHSRKKGTFVVQHHGQTWGNDVVYGALFLVNDFHFHIRALDAYQGCSYSALNRNHVYDLHHRITTHATPIYFQTKEEFSSLRYKEGEPLRVHAYVGNINHPNITKKLRSNHTGTRIREGLDKPNFIALLEEVLT
jgi:hypothetical protein